MTIYQAITMVFALSLPIVVLVVVARLIVSVYRSLRTKHYKWTVCSILSIAAFLLLFAGLAVVWFAYGVSHGKKALQSDLILLSISGVLVYGSGFGLWRLARLMDRRSTGTT